MTRRAGPGTSGSGALCRASAVPGVRCAGRALAVPHPASPCVSPWATRHRNTGLTRGERLAAAVTFRLLTSG